MKNASIDNLFIDMIEDRDFADSLLDHVVQVELALWDLYFDAVGPYINIVQRASDLGTQLAPFISPRLYKEVLKPHEARIFQFIKEKAPQVNVCFNSCGSLSDLIEDFIDIGVDILNPVQQLATGMESSQLKKRYGDRLCFHGDIDLQEAFPGSMAAVRKEVETRIRALAPGGGYLLAPANHIQADTPAENVIYLYEYAGGYGSYPLKNG